MTQENKQEVVLKSDAPVKFDFFNPEHFQTMQRVCTMFAASELVPDMYRITPNNPKEKAIANCMIALEVSTRIGASPLMVMQNMYIVYGRPGWSSKFLIATVNTCGRFNSIKYKFKDLGKIKVGTTEIDNIECIAYTAEKGSDDILESTPVSIKMAIDEGWYEKKGSKWKTMPIKMLKYRAASFWTNEYAPEISMGMKTAEEIEDIEDIDFEDIPSRVKTEIKENANKSEIKFDAPPAETSAISNPEKQQPVTADRPAPTVNGQLPINGPGF